MARYIITLLPLAALLTAASSSTAALIITGAIDGPLSGGTPKAVELFATSDIADLSIYGVGSANNGGGSDGEEFTFPGGPLSSGNFVYIASESTNFQTWFGFAPDHTSGALGVNGDDALELFMNGSVIDVFGDINTDGAGQAWEYTDGWAYRLDDTGPGGTSFALANWTFSGINALDGETGNASAANPIPVGAYERKSEMEDTPDPPAAIPEPMSATVWTLITGTAVLCIRRRRS